MKTSSYRAPVPHDDLRQGMYVDYHPKVGPKETGRITSWNDQWVFVCFGEPGTTSRACHRSSLTLRGGNRRLR